MQKINVIQFLPYFPPHRWGLETVAEQLSVFYVKKWFGKVVNVTFDVGQEVSKLDNSDVITGKSWKIIGYKQSDYSVYLLPSFDFIPNFPIPKFWNGTFWEVLWEVKKFVRNSDEKSIIQTHTRFFLSSLLGGVFAKIYKMKWVHIEHGSDYVKLWSAFYSKMAYFYDRLVGIWMFRCSDQTVVISGGVKRFVEREFRAKEIDLIYNWIFFQSWLRQDNGDVIKIWFSWRLVRLKWVDILLQIFKNLQEKYKEKQIELEILGDGAERSDSEKFVKEHHLKNVTFLWFQNRDYVANTFLPHIDILVNPSYQEGLPTTVLEWLIAGCILVATDVWGTKEISNLWDLIIVEKGNLENIQNGVEKAILHYKDLRWLSANFVRKKFDWDTVIEQYFYLYNEV